MLRLRDVEIQGFKSFAEKTRIPFPGDILVVVGPNGAGKSNVTDAVLWALGEQSAKALRGKKMEDVIFNGTPKRPPAGSAQVLITFEDTDGTRYQVGRRLLRSGDSSYLMDGRTVRLKDVHDFLMRYAISTQGNYLVEQGEVAALLKANPEERRMIFEEVAGISHFKENRRSAFSKLESTQANLLRLNDIIMEVETQMGSLKRQAAKADRFVRLSDELRDRRRAFWGRSFGKLTAQRSALSRDLALLTDERQRRETALNRLQSDQEQAALRLSEHEASLSALIESIHTKDLEHERAEQEIKRRTEQIANANGRIRQIGGDREDLRKRVLLGEKELERLQEELAGLESDEASAKATSDGALTTLESARTQVATLEERRRTLNQQSFEQAQEKARLSSELKSLEDDLRRLDERERRIDRERDGLTARQQGLAEALETRTNERERAAEALEATRRAREEAEQRAEALQSALEQATAALAETKQRAAAAESRLAVLRSHEAALRSSAHAFLKERDAARVKKTLAEALARVPADLVPALSAALGDLLEGYVETEWEGLPDLLASLQSQKAGEAVFYLKGAGQSDRRTPDLSGRKGFEGWLHEAQGVPKGLKEHLPLAALCADATSARTLAQEARVPAVSRDGLYAHPDGWVRGGSGGKGGATLLEHERDRVAAESDHDAALLAVAAATEALDGARAEREAARATLESARPAEAGGRQVRSRPLHRAARPPGGALPPRIRPRAQRDRGGPGPRRARRMGAQLQTQEGSLRAGRRVHGPRRGADARGGRGAGRCQGLPGLGPRGRGRDARPLERGEPAPAGVQGDPRPRPPEPQGPRRHGHPPRQGGRRSHGPRRHALGRDDRSGPDPAEPPPEPRGAQAPEGDLRGGAPGAPERADALRRPGQRRPRGSRGDPHRGPAPRNRPGRNRGGPAQPRGARGRDLRGDSRSLGRSPSKRRRPSPMRSARPNRRPSPSWSRRSPSWGP